LDLGRCLFSPLPHSFMCLVCAPSSRIVFAFLVSLSYAVAISTGLGVAFGSWEGLESWNRLRRIAAFHMLRGYVAYVVVLGLCFASRTLYFCTHFAFARCAYALSCCVALTLCRARTSMRSPFAALVRCRACALSRLRFAFVARLRCAFARRTCIAHLHVALVICIRMLHLRFALACYTLACLRSHVDFALRASLSGFACRILALCIAAFFSVADQVQECLFCSCACALPCVCLWHLGLHWRLRLMFARA
jgi:hypothetical protein